MHACGACTRTFPTLNEVFSHECPNVTGRWARVPNGFGGTTTVRTSAASSTATITRRVAPAGASEPSKAFLRSLLAERAGIPAAEAIRDGLNVRRERGQLTQVVVSEAIDRLKAIPRPPRENGTQQRFPSLPDVPAGHYAIPSNGNNDLEFLRVDRPTTGSYAGRTFVKRVIGGKPEMNVPYRQVAGVLARILDHGVAESARLYGQEIGRCFRCNRTLTDQTSRALGIGPECRSK